MPCAAVRSVAPRMGMRPRLEARMTMGERGDSRARLRKVKDSRSSMCTCGGEGVSGARVGDGVGQGEGEGEGEGAYFVDEEDAGDQLGETLVDISIHDLVDLCAQLFRDFSLLWLHQLAHHTHDILSTLRPRIRNVKIM